MVREFKMRFRTIKRRLQLSMLPDEEIKKIHKSMKGISDESTALGGKNNHIWFKEVCTVMTHYINKEVSYEN